jgi:RNA-directed DNA polymerase
MSGQSDKTVLATSLTIVDPERLPKPDTEERERERVARARRAAERQQAAVRWQAMVDAGGGEAWIAQELRQKGLLVDVDPSSLSDAEKGSYKERKKAEAQARRELAKLALKAYLATHVDFVGAGIYYRETNEETAREKEARFARAKANDLTSLDSPEALAQGLGLDAPTLRWLCFHREVETSTHYQHWTIPKRDGSRRPITAPKFQLKRAQRWLLRNVVEKLAVHGAAHGFLRARSIGTNASVHAGADVVVKIDVKDFFPTVTFRRVKGLFFKAGLPENVATLCALLCTEPPRDVVQFRGKTLFVASGQRACPQGAPTSPAITNALCMRLDRRLSGLARTLGYSYSRYADDLAFSWRKPADSANSRAQAPIGSLLHGVSTILAAEGFRVHEKKTAVRRAGSSTRLTGLVGNKPTRPDVPPARVPRETVRRLRAALHNREQGKPGKEGETLHQLRGMAAFIFMVDPKKGRAFLDRIDALERRAAAG